MGDALIQSNIQCAILHITLQFVSTKLRSFVVDEDPSKAESRKYINVQWFYDLEFVVRYNGFDFDPFGGGVDCYYDLSYGHMVIWKGPPG